jgi:redox-sensitive bicupin YhaK (pirin superfamily)
MSAGTGVTHSEYNASKTEAVHFMQIWVLPSELGIKPGYEQKSFAEGEKRGRFRVVASPDAREGSITIHADALVFAGLFGAGESAARELASGRNAWVQVVRGRVRVNGRDLKSGDGAALTGEKAVGVEGLDAGEVLVFDLA